MIDTAVHAFVTLFVIIDPISVGAIFLGLSDRFSAEQRRRVALNATIIATVVLLLFAFGGEYLFRLLGISISAFSIAGGALLFLLAIDMVLAKRTGLRSTTVVEDREAESKDDITVFPLAIPLIAGPGALTSILLLMGQAEPDILKQATVIGVVVVVMALTAVFLRAAGAMVHVLGVTGVNVIGRVFGIILAALAIQYILNGVKSSGLI
jgi:MarC family membrane protein